jgi:hypothetical protein
MTSTHLAAPQRGRRTIRASASLMTAIALFGAIACGGDSSTSPSNKSPVGPYGLVQVDTKAIPVEIFRGPYYDPDLNYSYQLVLKVTGGEVILTDDGRFHLAVDRNWSAEGQQGTGTLTVEGTYRIDGSKIYIDTDSGSGSGSYQNGNITLSLDVGETGTMKKYTFRHAP